MQPETCSTTYSPRASRSGVASIFSADAGREAGFRSASQEMQPAISATTTNTSSPTIFKNVFMVTLSCLEQRHSTQECRGHELTSYGFARNDACHERGESHPTLRRRRVEAPRADAQRSAALPDRRRQR